MVYKNNTLKERALSLALCLCMVLSLLPVSVFADGTTACETTGCSGTYNSDGFCTADPTHYQPATLNSGVYGIENAGQLYWFAAKVNGGDTGISGKLKNNIIVNANVLVSYGSLNSGDFKAWTPIGNSSRKYTGSFDGCGYTISGLYFNDPSAGNVGLFGYADAPAYIKNVGVVDSYLNGSYNVGGIVGYAYAVNNSLTISSCFSNATINAEKYVGGIVGEATSSGNVTVTNCYSSSTVSGKYYVGGVAGYVGGSNPTAISNCYSSGAVSVSSGGYDFGAIVGKTYGGGLTATNCYYLTGSCSTSGAAAATAASEDDFSTGKIAYSLNNGTTDGTQAYYQTLGTDSFPGFKVGTVYQNTTCQGEVVYGNEQKSAHNFGTDGKCIDCQAECTHEHVDGDKCADCKISLAATYKGKGYVFVEDAFEAANNAENANGTITLLIDYTYKTWLSYTVSTAFTLDLNGHTLAGNINVNSGSFTLKDGSQTGEGTLKGSVTVTKIGEKENGSFTMNSGHITGCSSDYAVKVENGQFIMLGGDIKDNTAGGVYVGANGSITVGGAANVTDNTKNSAAHNVYLSSGRTVVFNGTGGYNGTLGITTQDKPTESAAVTLANYDASKINFVNSPFTSDASGCYVKVVNGTIVLAKASSSGEATHWHCICGDTNCTNFSHSYIGFTGWTTNNALPTASGSYYLANNVSMTGWLVGSIMSPTSSSVNIKLCLNGNKITANGSYGIDVLDTLIVTDCVGSGSIETSVTNTLGTFELYGGSVKTLTAAGGTTKLYEGSSVGTINVTAADTTCLALLPEGYTFYDENGKPVDPNVTTLTNVTVKECTHPRFDVDTCAYCGKDINSDPTVSSDGYYEIYTASQLYWFAENINKTDGIDRNSNARLMADITVNKDVLVDGELNTDSTFNPWTPILCYRNEHTDGYTGTFDGNGKTISGLYFSDSSAEYGGLFAKVNTGGTVKNVTIADSYFSGNKVGGIVGYCNGGTVTGCSSSARVIGSNYVGGVVGKGLTNTTIEDCTNSGKVSGTKYVGGIVGDGNGAAIKDCSNSGTVSGTGDYAGGIAGLNANTLEKCSNSGSVTGKNKVGGIIGSNDTNSKVTDCTNSGSVYATENNAGGIAGYNWVTVEKCSNTGLVYASTNYAGGVVGCNNGTTKNCFNTGDVCAGGVDAGGIAGGNSAKDDTVLIENCYNTGTVSSGSYYVGGIVGYQGTSQNVKNCWYLEGCAKDGSNVTHNGIGSSTVTTVKDTEGVTAAATADDFSSGKVTSELNGGVTDGTQVWYQTCGTGLPAYTGETVYAGYIVCTGKSYSNKVLPSDPVHSYGEDGFCTACDAYEQAVLVGDYYEIGNAGQLYWFAAKVNGGDYTINGKLIADIKVNENVLINGALNTDSAKVAACRTWTPISSYKGSFDGNGKTISGLYYNDSNKNYVGLFAQLNTSGKVEKVNVADSYFNGDNQVGSIAGENQGTISGCTSSAAVCANDGSVGGIAGKSSGTVTGCSNSGTVSGGGYVGGIVGQNDGGAISKCYNSGTVSGKHKIGGVVGDNIGAATLENCYNIGDVSGGYHVGGIAGRNKDTATLKNCYNAAKVSGTGNVYSGYKDMFIGAVVGNNASTVKNCYYKTGCAVNYNGVSQNGIGADSTTAATADTEGVTEAKDTEFATGEVAYLLNGSKDNGVWKQNLDVFATEYNKDEYPNFTGAIVYGGYKACEDFTYSNRQLNPTQSDHVYNDDGFCTTCDAYKPAVLNNGYYEIENAGQLFWFAEKVNSGDTNIDAEVFSDITIPNAKGGGIRTWTPIGSSDKPYTGSFEGNGKTIASLNISSETSDNVGMFGCLGEGAYINGVCLKWATIYGRNNVGSLVGSIPDNSGNTVNVTIEGCMANSTVQVNGAENVGGLVGYSYGTIKDSSVNSTVTVTGTGKNVGGLVGTNGGTITSGNNNQATVTGKGTVGGIAGYNAKNATIDNSTTYGRSVTGTGDNVGGIAGSNAGTITGGTVSSSNVEGGNNVGGLVGTNSGVVQKSYSSSGGINGSAAIGGLVGSNKGTVNNCYTASGSATGTGVCVGGLVGANEGSVKNSYNNGTDATGSSYYVGHVVGGDNSGTISNCFYVGSQATAKDGSGTEQNGLGAETKGTTTADAENVTTRISSEQRQSGELAYRLNKGVTDGTQVWYQTCNSNTSPAFDPERGTVYYGYINCSENTVAEYTNTPAQVTKPEHGSITYTANSDGTHTGVCSVCGDTVASSETCTFDNGKCTVCNYECKHPTKDKDGFCAVCGMSATEPKQVEGVYEISNVAELYWFAQYVNKGNTETPAKLTADIEVNPGTFSADGTYTPKAGETVRSWTPISYYYQSFDGQGHTISGLYCNLENYTYVGFFGQTGGNFELKNLNIANSYFAGQYAGAIVGSAESTVSKCSVSSDVFVKGSLYSGGIAGYMSSYTSMTNCYSLANVADNGTWGGLVGESCAAIKNCYTSAMQPVGYSNRSYGGSLENVYYAEDTRSYESEGGYVTVKPKYDGATEVKDFSTGEIAWKLQNGVDKLYNEETGEYDIVQQLWYQTIGTQTYPAFSGSVVYQYTNCVEAECYSNTPTENGLHKFDDNGFCAYSDTHYQPAVLNGDTYEISNAGQLYWFAEQVNSGETTIKGKLMQNITVNPGTFDADGNYTPKADETVRSWTPIGTEANKYCATFDGNWKTVYGLYFNDSSANYVGLFGYAGQNGSYSWTIKAVAVENSYFCGDQRVGGIAGCTKNVELFNCLSSATVVGSSYVGGVVGDAGYSIRNCCSAATVKYTGSYVGALVGNARSTVTNSYYLDTNGVGGSGIEKPEADFKSGAVTVLLNQSGSGYWKQTLGTDAYPNFTGGKVYTDNGQYSNEEFIKVSLTWLRMDFCYSKGTWNTDTLTWDNAGWQHIYGKNSGYIRIENNSNTTIVAEFGAKITDTQTVNDNNLKVSFYTSSLRTEDTKLTDNKKTIERSCWVYVGMTGDKPTEEFDKKTIGQITVTFSVPDT